MGLLQALLGSEEGEDAGEGSRALEDGQQRQDRAAGAGGSPEAGDGPGTGTTLEPADVDTLARYLFFLQTAAPEVVEEAHVCAFDQLAAADLNLVAHQLALILPREEAGKISDAPRNLARWVARLETRQPGLMERMFTGPNAIGQVRPLPLGEEVAAASSENAVTAGGLLAVIATGAVESPAARTFYGNPAHEQAFLAREQEGQTQDFAAAPVTGSL